MSAEAREPRSVPEDWTTRHRRAVASRLKSFSERVRYQYDATFHAEVYEEATRQLRREDAKERAPDA